MYTFINYTIYLNLEDIYQLHAEGQTPYVTYRGNFSLLFELASEAIKKTILGVSFRFHQIYVEIKQLKRISIVVLGKGVKQARHN